MFVHSKIAENFSKVLMKRLPLWGDWSCYFWGTKKKNLYAVDFFQL